MRSIEEIRRAKRKGEDISDEEFEMLGKLWKSDYASPEAKAKATTYKVGDYPNSPLDVKSEEELKQASNRKPWLLYCSFCGVEMAHAVATVGNQPTTSRILVPIPGTDPVEFENKIVHSSIRKVACPECALEIKPVTRPVRNEAGGFEYDKNGNVVTELVSSGIKWEYHTE